MNFLDALGLAEGVNDPGIYKGVFLAGGPGSGKSTVAKRLFGVSGGTMFSSRYGLRLINSDIPFERYLHRAGISLKSLSDPKVLDVVNSPGGVRMQAKKVTDVRQRLSLDGRLGLIIDGTGKDKFKMVRQNEELRDLGYETFLVFVNTSLETALSRNQNRERTLAEEFVREAWHQVQENLPDLAETFGENFFVVSTDDPQTYEADVTKVSKLLDRKLLAPPKNSVEF